MGKLNGSGRLSGGPRPLLDVNDPRFAESASLRDRDWTVVAPVVHDGRLLFTYSDASLMTEVPARYFDEALTTQGLQPVHHDGASWLGITEMVQVVWHHRVGATLDEIAGSIEQLIAERYPEAEEKTTEEIRALVASRAPVFTGDEPAPCSACGGSGHRNGNRRAADPFGPCPACQPY